MLRQRRHIVRLGMAFIVLCRIGLSADEASFAILNAGVSSTEDAPFVTRDYSFLPGDAVYVTFQISGFKVKANDATDVRQIALDYTVTMQDEANVSMAEPINGEIKEQLSPEDKSWIPKRRASFVVPSLVAAGDYRIRVTAKDSFGGADAIADVPFHVAGERLHPSDSIKVENFHFLRQGESREALALAAYRPGDTIFTSFDIVGFEKSPNNKYDVSYGISVTGPDGRLFLQQTNNAEVTDSSFYPAQFLPERADVLTKPTSLRGEYIIALTVQDLLAHKTYTVKQAFTLE